MTTPIKLISSIPGAPKAVGPYSPAARVGDLLFLSGQIGLNPESNLLAGEALNEQVTQALINAKAILTSQGLNFSNVVKTSLFLTTMADFQEVNKIYAEHFGEHKPARSTFAVAGLPLGAKFEIEIIAHF